MLFKLWHSPQNDNMKPAFTERDSQCSCGRGRQTFFKNTTIFLINNKNIKIVKIVESPCFFSMGWLKYWQQQYVLYKV